MADKTTKVLEVIVDNNKAVASIAEYNQLIDDQKAKQKALADEYKAGNISQVDYQRALAKSKEETKAYSRSVQELSKEIQNNIKDGQEQEGSLRGLRAQLSNLTKEYDALSRAERQGGAGQALVQQINSITNELKEAEEETQRFYRNVGNYPDVKPLETQLGDLKKALAQLKYEGKDNTEEFAAMSAQAAKMKDAIADVEQQVNSAASDTKGLDTAVSGLSTTISGMTLLSQVFADDSEEGKKLRDILLKLQLVMASLNVLRTIQANLQKQGLLYQAAEKAQLVISNGLRKVQTLLTAKQTAAIGEQTIAQRALNAVVKAAPFALLVGGITAAIGALGKFFGATSDSTENLAAQKKILDQSTSALEEYASALDATVSYLEQVGRSEANIKFYQLAGLLDLAAQAKSIYQESIGQEDSVRQEYLANYQSRLRDFQDFLRDLKSEALVMGELYDRMWKDISIEGYELEFLAVDRATADWTKLLTELVSQGELTYEEATKAINYIEWQAIQEKKAIWARYEEERVKEAEAAARAIREATQRELGILDELTDAKIAAMTDETERLKAEEKERSARTIRGLKDRLATEKNLTETERKALNELIELEEQRHQQAMAAIDANAAEAKRKADEEAAEAKRKADEEELRARIEAANAEKQAIMDAVKLEWENRINEAANRGKSTLQMEIEAAKARMDALQQLEGESDAEFKARQLQAEREYIDAKKALNGYEVQMEQAKYDAIANMVGGLGAILEAFGEENEALAKASKVLALAEIAISTGKAIAAGVAEATKAGPFPANLAAIATTITTVLTNIATAVSTVKSAKFATGGVVRGAGTGTSDSIPAMLSNGESVMTAKSTAMFSPLLSAMNQAGGGVSFNPAAGSREGFDFLAAAVESGMKHADIHVAVDEISRVNSRVKSIKERSRI